MKRLVVLASRPYRINHALLHTATVVEQEPDDKFELPCSKHHKMESFQPCQEEHKTAGAPQSAAEIASLIMQAKVDLANRILAEPAASFVEEIKRFRTDLQKQTVPAKRRLDCKFRLEEDGLLGGYRLQSYDAIWPILEKATEMSQIDVRSAAITQISANLQEMRRNPRRYVSQQGTPDLSDIPDVTEPESILSLMSSPKMPTETTKSPTKREVHPVSPAVEAGPSRLSDTKVPLLPAPSPKAEASPTKSSQPSSPLANTPAPQNMVMTSPALVSPASTLNLPNNEPKVFRAPSYDDDYSSSLVQTEQSSSEQEAASKLVSRPDAPTPSRCHRTEASTPLQTLPPQSATPVQPGSGLGLVDAIPPSTPRLPLSTYQEIDGNSATFNFGPTSPFFNSPFWTTDADPASSRRKSDVKAAGRRKSEPLIRSCYRKQAAARQSISPRKLAYSAANMFVEDGSSTAVSPLPLQDKHAAVPFDGQQTPKRPQSPELVKGGFVTPAISWAKMTGRAPPTAAAQSTPQSNHAGAAKKVFNVDMHQNPDIFGGAKASCSKHHASGLEQLARIAEDRCDGQANVVVTQENGRLFVRFKLPDEFAFMFPDSQGFDESRFTTTPSAISCSPRITFNYKASSVVNYVVSSPGPSPAQFPAVGGALEDRTTASSEFVPSPTTKLWSADEMTVDQGMESSSAADASRQEQTTTSPAQGHTSKLSSAEEMSRDQSIESPTTLATGQEKTVAFSDSAQSSANHEKNLSPTYEMAVDPGSDSSTASAPGLDATLIIADFAPSRAGYTAEVSHGLAVDQGAQSSAAVSPGQEQTMAITDFAPSPSLDTTQGTSADELAEQGGEDLHQDSEKSSDNTTLEEARHSRQAYDSPGRAYMRDFIRRSKPKRLSATETGSPIAHAARRKPLGAKNPNVDSPQKGKRKAEVEQEDTQSSLKSGVGPAQKRPRRHGKMTAQASADDDMGDGEMKRPDKTTAENAGQVAEEGEGSDRELADPRTTRRSARLRSQNRPMTTAPKSSIPTPITLGCARSGAGHGNGPKSAGKTGQQDLTQQTRMNTRKNRGHAEYPAQYLAKQLRDVMEVDGAADDKTANAPQGNKCVGWKDPLELQEDEKPKRGRPAKAKATQGETSIAKPARTAAAAVAQKQRAAKVAAKLGMSMNGTPGRVTRSAARSQE